MGAARRHLAGLAQTQADLARQVRADSGRLAEPGRTLAEFEPVHILCGGEAVMAEAQRMVGGVPNVTLHDIPTNDVWARDHGPMFLGRSGLAAGARRLGVQRLGRQVSAVRFRQRRAGRMAQITGRRRFAPGIILEGARSTAMARGTMLTTEPAC